jgi:hypothetical protein
MDEHPVAPFVVEEPSACHEKPCENSPAEHHQVCVNVKQVLIVICLVLVNIYCAVGVNPKRDYVFKAILFVLLVRFVLFAPVGGNLGRHVIYRDVASSDEHVCACFVHDHNLIGKRSIRGVFGIEWSENVELNVIIICAIGGAFLSNCCVVY